MATTISRSNHFGHLAVDELERFEKQVAKPLPEEFRNFLLEHNGGVPQPACFLAPEDPFEGDDSELSEREVVCFFALHRNPWNDSTPEGSWGFPLQMAVKDLLRAQGASQLLPIGKDWSGNYICVGWNEDNRGEIFFYDHEYEISTRLAASLRACLRRGC